MHVPMRTCVGCRAVRPQAELLRSSLRDGQVQPDRADRACSRGRSAYVCPVRACLEQAARRGGFARAFLGGSSSNKRARPGGARSRDKISVADASTPGEQPRKFTVDADRLWSAQRAALGARIDLLTRSGRSAALPRVQRLAALAAAMDAPAGRIS